MRIYKSYKYLAVIFATIILSGCATHSVSTSKQHIATVGPCCVKTTRYAYPATYYYKSSYFPQHYYFKHNSIYPYYHPYRYRYYKYYRW